MFIIHLNFIRLFNILISIKRGGNINKKSIIISLLLIFVVLLSASATFAADENVTAISETNDIETISTDDVSSSELSESSDDSVIKDTSNVVTKDNFGDYFDAFGTLTSDADELIFEGDFSELDISTITIAGENPVKFTGKDATFKNVQLFIAQNDVTIDGFNFLTNESNEHTRLIFIATDDYMSNIVISNNNITFIGPADSEAYAIFAGADAGWGSYAISGLQILNNNITYVGNTDGTSVNNVIRVNGDTEEWETSDDILVKGNTFDIQMPSSPIGYDPYTYAASPITEAIVFYCCENVTVVDNKIKLKYNKATGSMDTITVIAVYDDYMTTGSKITIVDNNITGSGHSYIYGIKVSADTFDVSDNTINITSDKSYANGINVEGPSSNGIVSGNDICLAAPTSEYSSVYGIYTWQTMGAISNVSYIRNNIDISGYLACAMEINQPDSVFDSNVMTSRGNFTFGIAASIRPDSSKGVITNNTINCLGDNLGFATGDAILKTASAGISTLGNAEITGNTIISTALGIVSVDVGNVLISDNTIDVASNTNKSDNYAIFVDGVDLLEVNKNKISFDGKTDGDKITNAVYIYDVENGVEFSQNELNIAVPSTAVPWKQISGTWVSFPVSQGIVIDSCKDISFLNNDIDVKYNDVVGDYDTIYAVNIKNSENVLFDNNEMTVDGHTLMYGVLMSANNFTVSNNNIQATSDQQYANCIDVEGPATGVIKNNVFTASAPESAYPVYGAMSNGDVRVNITENEINGDAYLVYGVQLAGKDIQIANNNITAKGNHTIGIGAFVDNLLVKDNNIVADASNVGDLYIWETMGTDTAGIKVTNGKVDISGNSIQSTSIGIYADGAEEVTIDNAKIDVSAVGDVDNYAVYVNGADKLIMTNSNVTFNGKTNGTTITNAVRVEDSEAIVSGNNFDITIPSAAVVWAPDYSGSTVISEGIVFDTCDNLKFENNNVNLKYDEVIGYYDTIYAVDIINSNNALVKGNDIDALGSNYIYGIKVTGDNFTVDKNNISTSSDYYAAGVDVEGPATGTISNNNILTSSDNSAYPIYSGMNGLPVSVNITGNDIVGDSYYVVGLELGGQKAIVQGNNISVNGNHTIGIGSDVDDLTVDNNNITSEASNEGDLEIWDYMGTDTTGIKVFAGNATISNNNIQTTGDYAADLCGNNATLTDNYLASKKGAGASAVANANNAVITGSTPELKSVLTAVDLYTVYNAGDMLYVSAVDENGDPIKNATIFLIYGADMLNATTDSQGVAAFFIDEWDVGGYIVDIKYNGNDTYGPKAIKTLISIEKAVSNIVAPKSVSVLLTAVKKGAYYTITLKDNRDNGLAGEDVSITFNGKTKTYTTDDLGVIKFKLSATKAGTQKLTVKFDSNENYVASTLTATVKINKEATKLTAKKKTFKAKKKTKKYAVTLKDSKGKAIKKVKVTIKVGKKTFKAKTNAKGKATFKIKKLNKKGTYKAKVKFAGNALYKAVTKSVKIKVKK